MSNVYILVKNYGYDGLRVHGVTADIRIAEAWRAAGDYETDVVTADIDSGPLARSIDTWRQAAAKDSPTP